MMFEMAGNRSLEMAGNLLQVQVDRASLCFFFLPSSQQLQLKLHAQAIDAYGVEFSDT
jgi:hypothetical protein